MASFVRADIKFLSRHFDLRVQHSRWRVKSKIIFIAISQFFFLLWHLPSSEAVIVSFGGYLSFFPVVLGKILKKPVFIILHGTDCCSFPEIGYGNLRGGLLRFLSKVSYRYATRLLPVSESLIQTTNTYFDPSRPKVLGLKNEFPCLSYNYQVIPNGFDTLFWTRPEHIVKEPGSFLTVASPKQFVRKGIDLILEVARDFPKCKFYIVGSPEPQKEKFIKPGNVFFLGSMTAGQLKEYYGKTQFYLQLSVFEGFGCSLCEAMLCECIPIGSNANYIPGIIGPNGFILERRDSPLLSQVLTTALNHIDKDALGKKARDHVRHHFAMENREEMLMEALKRYHIVP